MSLQNIKNTVKQRLSYLKADKGGTGYVTRLAAAWIFACAALSVGTSDLFTRDFAANADLLLYALLAAAAFAALTVLRYIPKIKEYKTDGAALLLFSAFFAVRLCTLAYGNEQRAAALYMALLPLFALVIFHTVYKLPLKVPALLKKCSVPIIAAAAVLMFVFAGAAQVLRYYLMFTPAYDFGIFAQMFENMKDTFLPVTTLERGYELSHFAVHFSPAYYIMLPFYILFPHPVTLQILQGAAVVSGIIPTLLICRRYGFSSFKCAVFCVIYALYPAFSGGCAYDLHENCMLLPFMMWLFWAIEKEKRAAALIFAALVLLVKEDAAVYTCVVGLYLIFSDRRVKMRQTGVYILLASVTYFICACAYLEQAGLGIMSWRYGEYTIGENGGLLSVIVTVIINPGYVFASLLNEDKAVFALQMLAPLAFIPLISKRLHRYILLIPFILINLMPSYVYQHSVRFQYVFGSGALLFWLFIMNSADIKYNARRAVTAFAAVSAAMCFAAVMTGTARSFSGDALSKNAETISYLEQLPYDGRSITADTFFAAPLYKQKRLYSIMTSDDINDKNAPLSDIILLDRNMKNFTDVLNYYTALGYHEEEINTGAAKRICRLEKI